MRKATVLFMLLLALLLALPWLSHAGDRYHGGPPDHHGKPRVFIGGSFWFGPPPYWRPAPRPWCRPCYPRYYGGPVYYAAPPIYLAPQRVYVQQVPEEADYWYYCEDPKGFYPYIKSCPGGWMKVVPETVPPSQR
jgi:hypothetical protein